MQNVIHPQSLTEYYIHPSNYHLLFEELINCFDSINVNGAFHSNSDVSPKILKITSENFHTTSWGFEFRYGLLDNWDFRKIKSYRVNLAELVKKEDDFGNIVSYRLSLFEPPEAWDVNMSELYEVAEKNSFF